MTHDVGGLISLNVTFLSPVEPQDPVLQSLEFVYVYVDVQSKDGKAHSVQLYQDLSGEWTSSDDASPIKWTTTTSGNAVYHAAQKQQLQSMVTQNGMAEDVVLYHAALSGTGATYQTGGHHDVRSQFLNNGALTNSQDNAFRNINDNFPVFAFCKDLGTITSTGSSPVVWAVGMVRDRSINYPTEAGTQGMTSAWKSRWGSVDAAIQAFLSDSSAALARSIALDSKILNAASGISSQYADIVSLATRQMFGGLEVTVPATENDGSDIMMFLKDMGISERAQPVEVLYAAWPAIMYVNASWGSYLLEPLLTYEGSNLYQTNYSAPDLGPAYPSITGNSSPNTSRALEDSSSMLIMAYTHARLSGDGALIGKYYNLFKAWTDQLIPSTLTPNGFSTSDGQSSPNITNLALKGILGIKAMAEMSNAAGNSADAKKYQDQASTFISQWASFAGSSGHLTSTYGDTSSFGLMYNLYADKLMGTSLVPNNVYTQQTSFLANQASSAPAFGLQFDSHANNVAKSHWTMFAAGTMTDSATRDVLVSQVHTKATDEKNGGVFPSTYNANDGTTVAGSASAAVGGLYSLLALTLQAQTIQDASSSAGSGSGSSSSSSHTGAIVGAVVAVLAVAALAALGFFLWRRRARRGLPGVRRRKSANIGGLDPEHGNGLPEDYHNPGQIVMGEYNNASNTNLINGAASVHSFGNTESDTQQNGYPPMPQGAHIPRVPSSQSSSRARGLPPRSLRLHNGDSEDGHGATNRASTYSGSQSTFSTPQAPPLPSKHPITLSADTKEPSEDGAMLRTKGSISSRTTLSRSNTVVTQEATRELRDEVELLRREMAEMRSRTAYEPPPEYQ
ncbi:hypothetical protein D9758_014770 [Tetrapyrgos nigripes]|uniref:DUF1793-domain-containing protein n=1 Tax=Tetrapyrgos nigripes TaxID=182062 RepID=A0A8H5C618_9AGAR|nr:hypothetical protein D9758_014770 [Tetrapyrgos nigripes]